MNKRIFRSLMVGLIAVALGGMSFAAVSPYINVQGKLTPPPKADASQSYGTVSMVFTVTSPTIASTWTQTKDIQVDATTGIFNAAIGDSPSLLASTVLNNGDAKLNISLSYTDASNNRVPPSGLISIDESLNSAPYALRADAPNVTYNNPTYPNVAAALDNLFGAVYPASSSIAVNPNQGEKGTSVPVVVTWTVSNFTPTSQKINGIEATSPYQDTATDTKTYALVASDNSGHSATASAAINFYSRIFYGISDTAPNSNIAALPNSYLGSSNSGLNASSGTANYLYLACPSSMAPTFSTNLGTWTGWTTSSATYNGLAYTVYKSPSTVTSATFNVSF